MHRPRPEKGSSLPVGGRTGTRTQIFLTLCSWATSLRPGSLGQPPAETTGCLELGCAMGPQKWVRAGRETPLCATKGVRWSWRPDMESREADRSWGQGMPKDETQRQREGQGHRMYMGDYGCSQPPQRRWQPCQSMSRSPWSGPESPRPSSLNVLADETCPHMQGAGKHSPSWPAADSPAWGPWEALRALPSAANQHPQCC